MAAQPTIHLASVPQAPTDLMFGLTASFRADTSPQKVDLGVGAYRDDDAKPWVLPVVSQAKNALHAASDINYEYLPIAGLDEFVSASQRLVFGSNNSAVDGSRLASVQTLSGTGALHLGFLLLKMFGTDSSSQQVYVSDPPYANHIPIIQHVGLQHLLYPYYSSSTNNLDLEPLLSRLASIPRGSIVLLHASAHNPTGVDPSTEEWKKIAGAMKTRDHLPFFDSAYQGLASGNVNEDAWAIRYFVEQAFPVMFVAQSYAKNMGLYGERVGCLHVVASDANQAQRISSQLKRLQRVEISTPPSFGARVAAIILNDPLLYQQWLHDLRMLFDRISDMRFQLRQQLESKQGTGPWRHLTDQKGMFCFSGLGRQQVRMLRERFHIYTTPDGRFSLSGLNSSNVAYVANSIIEVTRSRSLL